MSRMVVSLICTWVTFKVHIMLPTKPCLIVIAELTSYLIQLIYNPSKLCCTWPHKSGTATSPTLLMCLQALFTPRVAFPRFPLHVKASLEGLLRLPKLFNV